MIITDVHKENASKKILTISGEVEPPATGKSPKILLDILDPIAKYLDYISVTYHADRVTDYEGDRWTKTNTRPGTQYIAVDLKQRFGDKIVPHVICRTFTPVQTQDLLIGMGHLKFESVLALQGDYPKGPDKKPMTSRDSTGEHKHASDLVEQISNLGRGHYLDGVEGEEIKYCVGVAGYPETHADSHGVWNHEMKWLKFKVDKGAHVMYTQVCFDVDMHGQFLERCREYNIDIPIVPGIQIISRKDQLTKYPNFFNCTIPEEMKNIMSKLESDEDVAKAGLEWAIKQSETLIERYDVPGLHLYGVTRGAPAQEYLKHFRPQ